MSFGFASDFITFWFNVGLDSDSSDTLKIFLLYKIVDSFLIEKNLLKFCMAIPAIPVENKLKLLMKQKENCFFWSKIFQSNFKKNTT